MTRPLTMTFAMALALCAGPALSEKREIVVAAESATLAVSRDLDRQLDAAANLYRQEHADGYAIVRFQRGENGRPANVTFYRRSGVSSVDRVARRAVSRLGARGGLPETGDTAQAYQANIVLATSEQSYRKLATELARAERQRLASRSMEKTSVAVVGASRTAS